MTRASHQCSASISVVSDSLTLTPQNFLKLSVGSYRYAEGGVASCPVALRNSRYALLESRWYKNSIETA